MGSLSLPPNHSPRLIFTRPPRLAPQRAKGMVEVGSPTGKFGRPQQRTVSEDTECSLDGSKAICGTWRPLGSIRAGRSRAFCPVSCSIQSRRSPLPTSRVAATPWAARAVPPRAPQFPASGPPSASARRFAPHGRRVLNRLDLRCPPAARLSLRPQRHPGRRQRRSPAC